MLHCLIFGGAPVCSSPPWRSVAQWPPALLRACGRRWVGHGVGGELVEPFFILRLALFGRRRGGVVNGHRFAWRRVGLPKRRCHLRAERKVCAGFPDGHRRPEWGRQDDAAQGLAGAGPADPGVDGMPVACTRDGVPFPNQRGRSGLSDHRVRFRGAGAMEPRREPARRRASVQAVHRRCHRCRGTAGFRAYLDQWLVRRSVPARSLRARPGARCARRVARRAFCGDRHADRGRPSAAHRTLARGGENGRHGRACPRTGARALSQNLGPGRPWPFVGRDARKPECPRGVRACRRAIGRASRRKIAMSVMGAMTAVWGPFADYEFMRRALAGCVCLSVGASPLGVILLLRRMSLVGDAMAHAILPGAALGYFFFGLSLPAMTAGGLLAGLLVVALAGMVSRLTTLREDASFASFYLI